MYLVSLGAAGFENVVAPLGTALTEEQARLLKRYTSRVLLLFDSDAAGLRATFKTADILLAEGLHPLVVTFPPGEDPDTLVRAEGAEGLQAYLNGAVDVLDRKLQILDQHDYFSSIDRRRSAVDKLLPTRRAVADPTLRDIYIDRVAGRTGVRPDTLEAELERAPAPAPARPFRGPEPHSTPRPTRVRSSRSRMGPAASLLRVLAQDRERRHEHLEYVLVRIGPEDFKNDVERTIFQAFVDDPELARPPGSLDPASTEYMETLLAAAADPDELGAGAKVLHESVGRMVEDRLYAEMDRIQAAIEATDDLDEKKRLLRQKDGLRLEAAAMGVRWASAVMRHARGFNESNRGL